MILFTKAMGLTKAQPELDFVNVPLDRDLPVFVDPFAISQRPDEFSRRCHETLLAFFQLIVDSIRNGKEARAEGLLLNLQEPNETRFGLSRGRPKGAGIGRVQARQLYAALRDSSAVKTGSLTSLEECELMIRGVSRDKISDLTTNVIRGELIRYTRDQCDLLNIPVKTVSLDPSFDASALDWRTDYCEVPVYKGKPVLLVPKIFVRRDPAYDAGQYYQHFVLNFLCERELRANSNLVRALKRTGERYVTKKSVRNKYPLTKNFLFQFSKDHPQVLSRYRKRMEKLEKAAVSSMNDAVEDSVVAEGLALSLKAIATGTDAATTYHDLMVGIVEFLFFPSLINPRKEERIHQGRKRIDIVLDNTATEGVFRRIHEVGHLPAYYVVCECKNYHGKVANPELDQLSGRFSTNRGCVGFLCYRNFDDRKRFVESCRDTFKDGRGLIVPLDDRTVLKLLALIEAGERSALDGVLSKLVDEVWLS